MRARMYYQRRQGNTYVLRREHLALKKPPADPPRRPPGPWAAPLLPGPSDPVDILLPLGSGSKHGNFELRVALRSIWRNASGYRNVVVVGVDPGFLDLSVPGIRFVERGDEVGNHEFRIAAKLAWALEHAGCARHVALWNDDYVLSRPTVVREVQHTHEGQLPEAKPPPIQGRYERALWETRLALSSAGRPAFHYDSHVPTVFERDRFLALADWWQLSGSTTHGLVVKSVYANCHLDQPGREWEDCKLKRFDPDTIEAKTAPRWVWSYSDHALAKGLKGWLERAWPARCPWERR